MFFSCAMFRTVTFDFSPGLDGADDDPSCYHDDRKILQRSVLLLQNNDSHHHVGHEGPSPEYHVQRHRYVEVERVVISNTRQEEEDNQGYIILEWYVPLGGTALGREDEAVDTDEDKLEEGDQISGARVHLHQHFQEVDIGAAADEDTGHPNNCHIIHSGRLI